MVCDAWGPAPNTGTPFSITYRETATFPLKDGGPITASTALPSRADLPRGRLLIDAECHSLEVAGTVFLMPKVDIVLQVAVRHA